MNVTPQDHPQVIAIARLCENLAPTVHNALDRIARELANIGYPDHTPAASASTAPNPKPELDEHGRILPPVTLTTVERAAAQRQRLTGHREQIRDNIRALALIVYSTQQECAHVFGGDTPINQPAKPRCYTGNLEGFLIPITEGGWSRPECAEIPRRGDTGPCSSCYMRHRRWRSRNGLKPLSEEIPTRDHVA